jgi:DNA-binding transcriptional LysR family regulator
VDPTKLDLNLIRIFCAVMSKRSTTLAGEELDITQSAVSNGLRRLRAHFADPLFIKTPQGMTPTPLAERLAAPLTEGLAFLHSTIEAVEAFDPRTSQRSFRIYMSDMGQLVLIPQLVRAMEEEAPGISLSVMEVPPKAAYLAMSEGGIDIAIGTFASFQSGFHSQHLFTKNYCVMGRRGHPAFENGLTLEKFLGARHAVYHPPAASHDDFEEHVAKLFRERGARRQVMLELVHGLGIVDTIAASNLLICVPQRLAETFFDRADVESRPLPFTFMPTDISQFWHHRMHGDMGHKWLRSLIFSKYANHGGRARRTDPETEPVDADGIS